MKVSMKNGGIEKWLIVTVASSDKSGLADGGKFNQLVSAPDWNMENIDFKIVMNGVEFDNLSDIFKRLEDHIKKEAEELAGVGSLLNAKLEALQQVMNAQSLEELE